MSIVQSNDMDVLCVFNIHLELIDSQCRQITLLTYNDVTIKKSLFESKVQISNYVSGFIFYLTNILMKDVSNNQLLPLK